jgi:hypothetical protein
MTEAVPLLLSDGTNSYIYGPGGLPIEQVSSGGTVTYLHHDQAGSTRLLTGLTGTVTGGRRNTNKQHKEGESEGEPRKHVIERCLGGAAGPGVEAWIAKTKFTPVGALIGCASGIYGPMLAEGIQSVPE